MSLDISKLELRRNENNDSFILYLRDKDNNECILKPDTIGYSKPLKQDDFVKLPTD